MLPDAVVAADDITVKMSGGCNITAQGKSGNVGDHSLNLPASYNHQSAWECRRFPRAVLPALSRAGFSLSLHASAGCCE